MSKSVQFSIPEVDPITAPKIPILNINFPKLYSYNELKNDEDIKKEIIKNELKIVQSKIDECNLFLQQIYLSVYVLVSLDNLENTHLHGVYSSLEKGTNAFNSIINYGNKITKLVLYKTFVDNLSGDFNITLFDQLNEDKVYEKIF